MISRRTVIASAAGLIVAGPVRAQPLRVPFEHANGKIFAPVTINGDPVQAMLDSGSAFYGLDQMFAAEAGVAATGRRQTVRGVQHRLSGRYGEIASLKVGDRTLTQVSALVLDYASLSLTVGRRVEMALGGDFFRQFVVDLDFADKSLALHDPAAFRPPADATLVALTQLRGLMTAPVEMPGQPPIRAIVDTGSDAPLILSPGPARKLGVFRAGGPSAPLGGIGGGSITQMSSAPRLRFAGAEFTDVPVQAVRASLGTDANLGLELLARFHVWLDFGNRRMWLKPGGEAQPFRRNLLGFYGAVEADGIRVSHVSPASPAAAAGFRAGEFITAINDLPAGPANALFSNAAAGTMVTFTMQGGAQRAVTLARFY